MELFILFTRAREIEISSIVHFGNFCLGGEGMNGGLLVCIISVCMHIPFFLYISKWTIFSLLRAGRCHGDSLVESFPAYLCTNSFTLYKNYEVEDEDEDEDEDEKEEEEEEEEDWVRCEGNVISVGTRN